MTTLFEGDFVGRATKAEFGTDKAGRPQARATIEIVGPDRAGTSVGYSGNFKKEAIKYTKRDMKALGWKGLDIATFASDVLEASEAGHTFPFQARIAEWTNPETGKLKQWVAAGSIGYEAVPLAKPTQEVAERVNQWLNEDEDDAPPQRSGSGSSNDDIPFAAISRKV